MQKLNVGIVGCGIADKIDEWGVGRDIARAYKTCKKSRLTAVCDIKRERANLYSKEFRVNPYYSIEKMLDKENLDIVHICTPMNKHLDPTLVALEAGVNVLCEKPLATNVKEGEAMVKKAKSTGKVLGVGFNRRWAMPWRLAKEHIEKGDLGDLDYIMLRRSSGPGDFLHIPPYEMLHQYRCHDFDMFRFIVGEITEVYAKFNKCRAKQTYKQAAIHVKFENGVDGFIMGCEALPGDPAGRFQWAERCEIMGSEKMATVDNVVESIKFTDHKTPITKILVTPSCERCYEKTFYLEVKSFVESLLAGKAPLVTGEDGVKAIQLVEAAIESFEKNIPIKPY